MTAEGGEGVAGDAPPLRPLLDSALSRHHDGDHTRLEGVTVHVALGDVVTVTVDPLNVLRSHVVTIGQLEDLLLVVDDLQGPVGLPLADVPGVEPALAVHHGGGHLGVPVVAEEHIGALDTHLTLALVSPVLHVGDVLKLDVVTGKRGPHVVRARVTLGSGLNILSNELHLIENVNLGIL